VIKELRERRGLTQEELAKRAGVSQGYIAKLEPSNRAGKAKTVRRANPSVAILKRLARALGVPVTELLE
jgi:transcriptional regulator with XRE-family HTH domain